jgi:hypothetical protein
MGSNGLPAFADTDALLAAAVADSAFPCAVAEVGSSRGSTWQTAHGTLSGDADTPLASAQTIFDLASLTKVLATALLAMRLVDEGRLGLDESVSDRIDRWRGADREGVTIRDLLSHTSGLPAYAPLYTAHEGRQAFTDAICSMPLEYEPRTPPRGASGPRLPVSTHGAAGCSPARCTTATRGRSVVVRVTRDSSATTVASPPWRGSFSAPCETMTHQSRDPTRCGSSRGGGKSRTARGPWGGTR